MEHRCGERIPTRLAAIVYLVDGDSRRGTVLNLGCGGAYVTLASEQAPPRGLVELELRLPYGRPRTCRWRAYVVHRQADGVGLMFDNLHLGDLLPLLAAEKSGQRLGAAPVAAERTTLQL